GTVALRLAVTASAPVSLLDETLGVGALRYGALYAQDATGRRLPARLAWQGAASGRAGTLRIVVQARGARYPLSIDPLFNVRAILAPTGAQITGAAGYAVALNATGTVALVGAPDG